MASITWKPNANGYWATAANWSGGVEPGAADSVTLTSAAAHIVYFNTTDTIASLTATDDLLAIGSGALTVTGATALAGGFAEVGGTLSLLGAADSMAGGVTISDGDVLLGASTVLTISGPATFGATTNNYGARIHGAGTLATTGVTSIADYNSSYGTAVLGGGLTWVNSGTVNQAGVVVAYFTPGTAFTLINQAGAVYDLTSDDASIDNGTFYNNYGSQETATSVFTNAGTLEKTGGAGGTSYIYAALTNTGTINVANGTLALENGGTIGGLVTGAGELALESGAFTLAAGLSEQTGTLLVQSVTMTLAGNVSVAGAFTEYSADIELNGNTLSVASPYLNYGTIDGAGAFITSGTTTLGASYTQLFIGGGADWINTGTIIQTGYYVYDSESNGAGTITNQASATYEFTSDYGIYNNGATGTFINAGTLEQSDTGTSYVEAVMQETGTISIAAGGSIEFDSGGTFAGVILGAGTLAFGGGIDTLVSGTPLGVSNLLVDGGTLELSSSYNYAGSFSLSGGNLELDATTLSVTSATLSSGLIDGLGMLDTSGTTTLPYTNALYVAGGVDWVNSGVVNIQGSDQLYLNFSNDGAATFTNLSGASLNFGGDGYIVSPYGGSIGFINNAGTLAKVGGTNTSYVQVAIQETGTISVSSGTMEFDGGGTFSGAIIGSGTVAFGGGTNTLAAGTPLFTSSLLVDRGTLALGGSFNYTGSFSLSGGNLDLDATTFSVKSATLSSGLIDGPGTLNTSGTTTLPYSNALYVAGGVDWVNSGVVIIQSSDELFLNYSNDGAATFSNLSGASLNFTGDGYITSPYGGSTGLINNAGTLAKLGGTNTSYVQAVINDTGTISVVSGTIEFDNGGTFTGAIFGKGTVAFEGAGVNFGNLIIAGTTAVELGTSVNLTGNTSIASSINVDVYVGLNGGDTLSLSGTDSFGPPLKYGINAQFDGAGTVATSGTVSLIDNGGNVDLYIGGGADWAVAGKVTDAGAIQLGSYDGVGTISNAATGVFNFTSDDAQIYNGVSYDIYGNQTPVIGTFINAGLLAKVTGTATNTISAVLIDTGTLSTNAGTLAFEEGGTLSGAILSGSHVSLAGGDFFVTGLSEGGTLTVGPSGPFTGAAQIDQTGAVTLGIGSVAGALTVSGVYNIDNDSSIGLGGTAATTITVSSTGSFGKLGGTGVSTIAAAITDNGLIFADAGRLLLAGAVSGTGKATIANGASLEVAGSIASTVTVTMGSSSELLVDQTALFKAKIANFVAGDTLDIGGLVVTSATGTSAGLLTLYNNTTAVGTLQLVGNPTGNFYTFTSNGSGGTLIGIARSATNWIGGNNDWTTGGAWSAGVPGAGTDATIAGTATETVTIGAGENDAAHSLTLSDAKATLAINGTLTIGTSFAQSAGTVELAGTINGSTVNVTGGNFAYSTPNAMFSNVVYEGAVNLSQANGQLTVLGGTLAGAGGVGTPAMNITGQSAGLFAEGVYTLASAAITLGNSSGPTTPSYLEAYDPNDTGALFTLGTAVSVTQLGLYADIGDYNGYDTDGMFNSGAITGAVSGGTLSIVGNLFENDGTIKITNADTLNITTATFTNAGTLSISGSTLDLASQSFTNTGSFALTNSTLNVGGSFSTGQILSLVTPGNTLASIYGTLNNTGATLLVGTGTTLGKVTLAAGADIVGGTISDAGGGIVFTGDTVVELTGPTLTGVTYDGALNITQTDETVFISNGITLASANGVGPGTLNITGASDRLEFASSTTLNNATIALGYAGASQFGDSIEILDSSSQQLTLSLGAQLSIVDSSVNASANFGDYYGFNNDTIVNSGTVAAVAAGATFHVDSINFANKGILQASGGGVIDFTGGGGTIGQAATLTNLAGSTLTGGTYSVGANSTIEFAKNTKITVDAADIILSGTASNIQALSGSSQIKLDSTLATIASTGTLTLLGGRNFTGTQAFTDAGQLSLGGTTFTTGSLTVASTGTLSGGGTVTDTVVNSGLIFATTGGTLKVAGVAGTGTMEAAAGGVLEILGTAAATQTVIFGGPNATLRIDAAPSFSAALGNFGAGDVLDFSSLANATATASGTTLTVKSGTATYTETINALASGTVLTSSSDGAGGTNITAYRQAAPSLHSPEPVAFGQVHVGATLVQALTIANTAPADGYSEALDGSIGGASALVTASGSFSLLAAGSTSTALTVSLASASTGTESGTAIITLASDGNGIDGNGTTSLGTQTVNLSATVFAYATASSAPPVSFGQQHVGATLSQFITLANTAAPGLYSENLDASFSGTSLGLTESGSVSGLAAGATSSTSLSVTLVSGTAGVATGAATLALVSDGAGIDTLASTTLTPETLAVSGTLFNYATASTLAPISFGQRHVGATLSQSVTLANTAAPGLYSENLDASFSGTSLGLTESGSLSELAAGATNSSALAISLASGTAGVASGTTTLALVSDGAGIDTLSSTTLAPETLAVSGTLFNFATASTIAPINFGQRHVGSAIGQAIVITNTAAPGSYSENLDAGFSGTSANLTALGTISELAAGASNSTALTVTLHSGAAGTITGATTINLTSDGSGIDSLGTTALASKTLSAIGTLFNYATASLTSKAFSFGIVHVGQTIGQFITISNKAATGNFSENLDAGFTGTAPNLQTSGTVNRLIAGGSNGTALDVVLNTGTAGTIASSATLKLASDGTGIDTLGTTVLASQIVTVTGTVDNYATAAVENIGGAGTLSGSGTTLTLSLGTVAAGGTLAETLGVLNSATGPADLLSGSFAVGSSAGFADTGFNSFSGVAAGGADGTLGISLSDLTAGTYTQTIVLNATGSNASGYSGTLTPETILVTGTVTSGGQVVKAAARATDIGTSPSRMGFAASVPAPATAGHWATPALLTGSAAANSIGELSAATLTVIGAGTPFASLSSGPTMGSGAAMLYDPQGADPAKLIALPAAHSWLHA